LKRGSAAWVGKKQLYVWKKGKDCTMTTDKNQLLQLLQVYGQEHLLQFWDDLDAAQRQQLAAQICAVDWPTLAKWISEYVLQKPQITIPVDLQPAAYYPMTATSTEQTELYATAFSKGEELLRAGKVAGFTVAGGQGTRLGFDGPKGTFPISLLRQSSLFQIFAEKVLRAQEKYTTTIVWYIMTSPVNDADTRRFFAEQNYFGLDSANIKFFAQGTLPAIGFDGKVLLASKDSLALSPNGHGGSLMALNDSGALADMAARHVEHISYWQVDNPLVQMFDPLFLGLHALAGSSMSSRSLTKTGAFEKLGNFCLDAGKLTIIEYSDMPEALATATDEHGQLRFRAGSPAIHLLRRDFVVALTQGELRLPLHRADKKVAYIGADGVEIEPQQPNAVKLEMFIFDALPLASNPLILEADRTEHFAPVKNSSGVDSVETCQALTLARDARWLAEEASLEIPYTADGKPDCRIELVPRRFLDRDDVRQSKAQLTAPAAKEARIYR